MLPLTTVSRRTTGTMGSKKESPVDRLRSSALKRSALGRLTARSSIRDHSLRPSADRQSLCRLQDGSLDIGRSRTACHRATCVETRVIERRDTLPT
jgi:hypothetical protein